MKKNLGLKHKREILKYLHYIDLEPIHYTFKSLCQSTYTYVRRLEGSAKLIVLKTREKRPLLKFQMSNTVDAIFATGSLVPGSAPWLLRKAHAFFLKTGKKKYHREVEENLKANKKRTEFTPLPKDIFSSSNRLFRAPDVI